MNYKFEHGRSYAITGNNGSGKSTLIKSISGALLATKGDIKYFDQQGKAISDEEIYKYLIYVAPYFDLIEEFTLNEALDFHFSFKPLVKGIKMEDLPKKMLLDGAQNKFIKHFSSGMKQRLKLGLAFFSDVPVVLLDEPCTNLDETGITWYKKQMQEIHSKRLIIISSNQKFEYELADFVLNMIDYK
ncbi:ATP-binding cassette domain-containing protein [Flammeovirgaceae bacterium KN852]|uniref:ATP-binding cassette domain-containing protein n=1 Tax=Marinigracilibium pacificum TaxID=2729599 RepID=A0A848J231_9BACT|nr:ATP-binding cassette domain-containing protein [Marinigracilibium pacificum]